MTNRILGDWNSDALEAFRSAYAQQLLTVEDQDVDTHSGLPSNTISNTSPWYSQVGTWRYPSGKGPEDDLKQPFNPDQYLPESDEDDDIDSLIDDILNEE